MGLTFYLVTDPLVTALISKAQTFLDLQMRRVMRAIKRRHGVIDEIRRICRTSPVSEPVVEPVAEPTPGYIVEWDRSLVNRSLTDLNLSWHEGKAAFDLLIYSDKIPRRNDGRINEPTLRRYQHLYDGGWYCSGMDLINGVNSLWGCFKPVSPVLDDKGKLKKYEHPLKIETELFALRISPKEFSLIARKFDVQLPPMWDTVEQNPFIFWQWVIDNPDIPVVVTEGAKKAACILSCGYVCVALPGVNSGVRIERDEYGEKIPYTKPHLIPQLKKLSVKNRKFYLAFDKDQKRSTIRNVNNSICSLSEVLSSHGCSVNIICWHPSLGKGVDDLLYNSYKANIFLGMGEENALNDARSSFDKLYRDAVTIDDWETDRMKELTYPVALEMNQRFIGEVQPPANKQFIGVLSAKNTGKSTWLKWLLLAGIQAGTIRVIGATHRNQLSSQLAAELKLPIITEASLQDSKNGFFLCVDSLHPKSQSQFNYQEWDGATVILDEVQQVIWHLLNSSTCQKHRVAIIKTLKNLLNHVVKTGGKIIVLDADLNDTAIDFINHLLDDPIEPWIVKNNYRPKPWNVYTFNGTTPAAMIKTLIEKLKHGERHMLCVSAQKWKSRWGTKVLEQLISKECKKIEKEFQESLPDIRILRVDSESVADPDHPAFCITSKLTDAIKNYHLLIASPTIETGVSIGDPDDPDPWFQGVWLIGQGLQTCDSVRQNLARYRPPVPRYVWIKHHGIGKLGNGSHTVKGLLSGEFKKDSANLKRLTEAGFSETIDSNFEPICLTTWAKMAAIINKGKSRYKDTILRDLEAEGHIIWSSNEIPLGEDLFIDPPTDEEIQEVKTNAVATRDEFYEKEKLDISNANSLTDSDYDRLSSQPRKREHERLEFRKGQLERTYLVSVTPELVGHDDNGWHSEIRLDYYLHEGRNYLGDRDKSILESALRNGNGDYFKVDTNQKILGNKIAAFNFIGFKEIESLPEISNDHPLAIQLFNLVTGVPQDGMTEAQAKGRAYAIQSALGKNLRDKKNPMCVVHEIYHMLGLKLPLLRREGGRGQQVKIFGKAAPEFKKDDKGKLILQDGLPIPVLDGRREVFEAWLQRDEDIRQKRSAEALEQDYEQMSQDEKNYVDLLIATLPDCDDQDYFDVLTKGTNSGDVPENVVVYALRQIASDVRDRVLEFCSDLKHLFAPSRYCIP